MKPYWKEDVTENNRSFATKKFWGNIFFTLTFISLLVIIILLSFQSNSNRESSQDWQSVAKRWEKQSSIYQKKLQASEADVLSLEKRQNALSSEKASAEDERSAYRKLTDQLIRIGVLQQNCSNRMATLAEKLALGDFSWGRKNGDSVLRICNRASERFQSIGKE